MLNYRHLYYFWVVCKEGGFSRAAERLGMAIQTISVQVRELEKSLGRQLLKPAGRGVALTEAGQTAYGRADEIFRIGEALVGAVQDSASRPRVRLAIGLSDGISKLAAHALLDPVLATPDLRLICHEGEFDELQAELALHRLDLVLAGQASPANPNLALSNERLVSSPVDWYGPTGLVGDADIEAFPESLERLPVLLPTGHSMLRSSLDQWFVDKGLRLRVVGEFEDHPIRGQPAAGQHALEHMPVVIGHRADQLGMHVEGQETPALLPLEEEVEGVERAHRAVEVHQLVVVAGLEKDRLGRHAPGVPGDDLQMRLVADHPCLALPHDRLEQGPQHTAGKTQPHPPIDDLEAFPAGARSGQTPALVEVMDEFGERHDGSP